MAFSSGVHRSSPSLPSAPLLSAPPSAAADQLSLLSPLGQEAALCCPKPCVTACGCFRTDTQSCELRPFHCGTLAECNDRMIKIRVWLTCFAFSLTVTHYSELIPFPLRKHFFSATFLRTFSSVPILIGRKFIYLLNQSAYARAW